MYWCSNNYGTKYITPSFSVHVVSTFRLKSSWTHQIWKNDFLRSDIGPSEEHVTHKVAYMNTLFDLSEYIDLKRKTQQRSGYTWPHRKLMNFQHAYKNRIHVVDEMCFRRARGKPTAWGQVLTWIWASRSRVSSHGLSTSCLKESRAGGSAPRRPASSHLISKSAPSS